MTRRSAWVTVPMLRPLCISSIRASSRSNCSLYCLTVLRVISTTTIPMKARAANAMSVVFEAVAIETDDTVEMEDNVTVYIDKVKLMEISAAIIQASMEK